MSVDDEVRHIARRQLALITREQLHAAGIEPHLLRSRVRMGSLERVTRRVYRVGGAPISQRQIALAAILDLGVGAAASHATSAALWRAPGYDLKHLHVTRMHRGNKRSTNLAVVHEPKLLLPEHIVQMGPMQVATPSRTLFDLAGMVHPQKLERTVDDMLAQRLTNVRALHEMLRLLARRGRPGIAAMRAVLDDRPIGYRGPESHLEARVRHILRKGGLPHFECQVDIGDEDGWIGRVDFLERPSRFILQTDGDRWHTQLVDRVADAAQVERLERAGYTVGRVTEAQVWMRPQHVLRIARKHVLRRDAA